MLNKIKEQVLGFCTHQLYGPGYEVFMLEGAEELAEPE
jgi:hypothetical protein